MSLCDMVLQRRTHQEPNRAHASAVPMVLPRAGVTMGVKEAVNMVRIMQWFVLAYAYE